MISLISHTRKIIPRSSDAGYSGTCQRFELVVEKAEEQEVSQEVLKCS